MIFLFLLMMSSLSYGAIEYQGQPIQETYEKTASATYSKAIIFKNTGSAVDSLSSSLSGIDSSLFKVSLNRCNNVAPNKTCQVSISSSRGLVARPAPYLVSFAGAAFSISVLQNGQSVPPLVSQEVLFSFSPSSIAPLSFSLGEKKKSILLNIKNDSEMSQQPVFSFGSGDLGVSVLINRCTSSVAPGRMCSVTLSVAAPISGIKTKQLLVLSNSVTKASLSLSAEPYMPSLNVDFSPNVNISGSSINCGISENNCSSKIPNEAIIALSASPSLGYDVLSWSLPPGCTLLAPTVTYCFINNGDISLPSPVLGCSVGYTLQGNVCIIDSVPSGLGLFTFNSVASTQGTTIIESGTSSGSRNIPQASVISFRITSASESIYVDAFQFPESSWTYQVRDKNNVIVPFNISDGSRGFFNETIVLNPGDYLDFLINSAPSSQGNYSGRTNGLKLSYSNIIHNSVSVTNWIPNINLLTKQNSIGKNYPGSIWCDENFKNKTIKLSNLSTSNFNLSGFNISDYQQNIQSKIYINNFSVDWIDWNQAVWGDPVAFWASSDFLAKKNILLQDPRISTAVSLGALSWEAPEFMDYQMAMSEFQFSYPTINPLPYTNYNVLDDSLSDVNFGDYECISFYFGFDAKNPFSLSEILIPIE